MKFAFMAQTNYQLINMIKFVYFNCEDSNGNSDIFIKEKLANSIENIEALSTSGLFNSIYVYKERNFSDNKIIRKLCTAFSVIRKNAFKDVLLCHGQVERYYDVIVIPSVSLESQLFWLYFKHNKVYLIEDGLGSITGNIVNDGMRKGRQKLSNLLYGEFFLDKMYVNNLGFNNSSSETEIVQIPGSYNNKLYSILSTLLLPCDYHITYRADDVIYLQQPVTMWQNNYLLLEKDIINECLYACSELLIIRCHPLTLDNPRFKSIRYDCDNYPWEVICANQITDKNILIGVFSTAQFSPKQLYDKEPYILFLFILLSPTNISIDEELKMYELLKTSYRHPEKIYLPKSIQELREVLKEIIFTR